jgi:hypothetical protein
MSSKFRMRLRVKRLACSAASLDLVGSPRNENLRTDLSVSDNPADRVRLVHLGSKRQGLRCRSILSNRAGPAPICTNGFRGLVAAICGSCRRPAMEKAGGNCNVETDDNLSRRCAILCVLAGAGRGSSRLRFEEFQPVGRNAELLCQRGRSGIRQDRGHNPGGLVCR